MGAGEEDVFQQKNLPYFWKMEWLMESIQESGCFFLPLDFVWSIQAEREKLELLERLVGESCRFVLGKTFRRSAGLVVRNKEQPPLLWRYVWDILYIIICISFFYIICICQLYIHRTNWCILYMYTILLNRGHRKILFMYTFKGWLPEM